MYASAHNKVLSNSGSCPWAKERNNLQRSAGHTALIKA